MPPIRIVLEATADRLVCSIFEPNQVHEDSPERLELWDILEINGTSANARRRLRRLAFKRATARHGIDAFERAWEDAARALKERQRDQS